jgi:hypothetical protein
MNALRVYKIKYDSCGDKVWLSMVEKYRFRAYRRRSVVCNAIAAVEAHKIQD